MAVLIGGGSGFIGRHLQKLLRSKGYKITLVSRTPGENAITWSDLARTGLPPNTDAVINLSGEPLINPMKRWNESFKSNILSSRLDTTKQLADAIVAAKHKPKVWVSTSAVGFYNPSQTMSYDEDSAGGTGSFLAEVCAKTEQAARLPAEQSDVRQVTVRIGIALGRDGGTIQTLFVPFFLGVGGRVSSGEQWFPWIHVDDVAGIFAHAVEDNIVTGVLNAVAPEIATNAQFTSAFAKAMWRPALFPVPAFVLRFVYGAERAAVLIDGQKVLPKRTLESGYQFKYPDLNSACQEFSRLVAVTDWK